MMIQTWALFVDAYRELNARKMFWVTLILSALFVGIFGLLGYNANGMTIFGKELPMPMPHVAYKLAFSFAIIGLWAKWGALILALISTASIFPDLLTAGSVDLYLSKPIGRLRLFLTKYASGLIFVLLQTTVIAAGSYLVFGLRAGEWRPSLFLLIPLIGLLFSYLFCVCTLLGVLTRSTIASILLTVLFWFVCFGVNAAEGFLFEYRAMQMAQAQAHDRQVREADLELRDLKANPSITNAFGLRAKRVEARREKARAAAVTARDNLETYQFWYGLAYGAASVIPKTGETVSLIDRKLFSDDDLLAMTGGGRGGRDDDIPFDVTDEGPRTTNPSTSPADAAAEAEEDARDRARRRELQRQTHEASVRATRGRSVPWIIGTSLAFEAVILVWAAWVFCRRDY